MNGFAKRSRRAFLKGAGAAGALAAASGQAAAQATIEEILQAPGRGSWDDQFDAAGARTSDVTTRVPILSPMTASSVEASILDYRMIVADGGWPTVNATRALRVGVQDDAVRDLRRRLMVSGDLPRNAGESATFDTFLDGALRFVAMTLFALPWFWFGIILILVFSLWLGWFPAFGRLPSSVDYQPVTNFILIDAVILGRPDLIGPWLTHLTLPALTVGLTTSGMLMRLARSGVIETSAMDFVRTARMKGVPGGRIFFRHILRNAALGILTVIGLQFGAMLGGSVIAEVVFGYPGIGRMMVDAVLTRDYAVAQGAALVIATLYVLINLATDLTYRWADPRLRREPGQ